MTYKLLFFDIQWDNGYIDPFYETSGYDTEDSIDIDTEVKDYQEFHCNKDGYGNKVLSYSYNLIEEDI
jgi:hypothetical protein